MPRRDAASMARLLETFKVEADEHVGALRRHLLELASAPRRMTLSIWCEATFRDMHTLKGAARSVGQRDVERVCASCEALLSTLRRTDAPSAGRFVPLLEEAVAAIAALVADGARRPPGGPARAPRSRCWPIHTNAAGEEAEVTRAGGPPRTPPGPGGGGGARPSNDPDGHRATSTSCSSAARICWRSSSPPRSGWATAQDLHEQVRRVAAQRGPGAPQIKGARHRRARTLATGLRTRPALDRRRGRRRARAGAARADDARVERARPAAGDAARPRPNRRASASSSATSGGELRVDRRVLEAIKDPLIHMVRNAVDHGMEPPEERVAAGKPRPGRSPPGARAGGGRVECAVADDGRGVDRRVQDAARRARVGAAADEDALALVFRSGLSTNVVITDVSGHGLGLAIVKEQVDQARRQGRARQRPRRGHDVPAGRAVDDRDLPRPAGPRGRPALPAPARARRPRDRRRAHHATAAGSRSATRTSCCRARRSPSCSGSTPRSHRTSAPRARSSTAAARARACWSTR